MTLVNSPSNRCKKTCAELKPFCNLNLSLPLSDQPHLGMLCARSNTHTMGVLHHGLYKFTVFLFWLCVVLFHCNIINGNKIQVKGLFQFNYISVCTCQDCCLNHSTETLMLLRNIIIHCKYTKYKRPR